MNEFQSGSQIKASELNQNFAELAGNSVLPGSGQLGSFSSRGAMPAPREEQAPAGWIRVQNNYPFRLEKLTVVGVDHPIIKHRISDAESLDRFLYEKTIWSCMSAQARHRNRIAVLQQGLMPGEKGWAVLEGLTKAIFHQAPGPNAEGSRRVSSSSTTSTTGVGGSFEAINQPWWSHETAGDQVRHLSIAGAKWTENGDGTEYEVESDIWGARSRPKWLFPADIDEIDFSTPFAAPLVTSHGRASGLQGYLVPELTVTGSSTAKCVNGAWKVIATTCSRGTSTWPLFEAAPWTIYAGDLSLPCVEDDEVDSLPCFQTLPYTDYSLHDLIGDRLDWNFANQDGPDANSDHWMVGNINLANPTDLSKYDGPYQQFDQHGYAYDTNAPCFFIADSTPDMEDIRRCCANITCTYERDGTDLVRYSPDVDTYRIGYVESGLYQGPINCICPDALVADRLGHEFANLAMPEITLGMIYSTTTTTTTTTSTTTTTTTMGACCSFEADGVYIGCEETSSVDCGQEPFDPPIGLQVFHSGESCSDTLCAHACCFPDGSCGLYGTIDSVEEGPLTCPITATYMGEGSTCSPDPCLSTTTTTTTTSSTTTTTGTTTTTTTTTSSTTTTTGATTTTTTTSSTTTTTGATTTTTTSSSTTTTGGECNGECTYQCQNTMDGPRWVQISSVGCDGACGCVQDDGIGPEPVTALCGVCTGETIDDVCGDTALCAAI